MKLLGKILLICALLMGAYGCEKTQDEPSLTGTVWVGESWPIICFVSSDDCFFIHDTGISYQYIHFNYTLENETVDITLNDEKNTITVGNDVIYTVSTKYQGTITSNWDFMLVKDLESGSIANTTQAYPYQLGMRFQQLYDDLRTLYN